MSDVETKSAGTSRFAPLIPLPLPVVASGWAALPIATNGVVGGPEWAGAGTLALPRGRLLVKNDATHLHVALDLTGDLGNDLGTSDYFWLTFDVDGDGHITARRDVQYGIYPTMPIRVGRQLYLGPGTWTGLISGGTAAVAARGFGASPASATPHRVWELRIPLAELGVTIVPGGVAPVLRFGLRIASSNPAFVVDYPTNFFNDFSALPRIVLATAPATVIPPALLGPVIGSVGLIPAGGGCIDANGYATTDASYTLPVKDAPFAGSLNLIANRTTLQAARAAGATRYRVLRGPAPAAVATPMVATWTNYRYTGLDWVLETVAPDGAGTYEIPDPAVDRSIDDLLFRWDTTAVPNGLHYVRVQYLRPDGTPVAPPAGDVLPLQIDNQPPTARLLDVLRRTGASIRRCDVVSLAADEGVRVRFQAEDPEGHLGSYDVVARYGDDATPSLPALAAQGYVPVPSKKWHGTTDATVPAAPAEFRPPYSCAYEFRVTARGRATDGYASGMPERSSSRFVTLQVPAGPPPIADARAATLAAMPLGLSDRGSPIQGATG